MPMLQKHLMMGSRILLGVALAGISFLATTSRQFPVVEDVNDKIAHVAAFYALGLLADFSWPATGFRPVKILSLLGYGLAIEAVQYNLPYRSFSVLDLAADAAGLLLFAASVPVLKRIYPLSVRFTAADRAR